MTRKGFIGLLILALVLITSMTTGASAEERITLATTTSTDNSGLLGYLLPAFQAKTGYRVDVVAVGTGAAIKLGRNGDADVVLVHARSAEDEFVASGFGIGRRDVMYNDFVVLGPPSDPAGVRSAGSAAEAFRRIAAAKAEFVSRGDNSGTHIKEKELWAGAAVTPQGSWYKEAGQGMGAVITMTENLRGYTLTDRGTYLAMKTKVNLQVVSEGDPLLFNPYGVIAVNPEKHPHVNSEGVKAFIDWLTGPEGQKMIAAFTVNGEQLFYPDAGN